MSYPIGKVTGGSGGQFREAGISTSSQLLKEAAAEDGIQDIAERTGYDKSTVERLVSKADLMRLKGVGSYAASLLVTAGKVDSVEELLDRDPRELSSSMRGKGGTRAYRNWDTSLSGWTSWGDKPTPDRQDIEGWILQGAQLPPRS